MSAELNAILLRQVMACLDRIERDAKATARNRGPRSVRTERMIVARLRKALVLNPERALDRDDVRAITGRSDDIINRIPHTGRGKEARWRQGDVLAARKRGDDCVASDADSRSDAVADPTVRAEIDDLIATTGVGDGNREALNTAVQDVLAHAGL